MSDLISRQDAIDAMCSVCGYDCDKSKFVYNAPRDEQVIMCPEHYALSTLPSAQPERKGKWVHIQEKLYRCSECGAEREQRIFMEYYCPNCGAYMYD